MQTRGSKVQVITFIVNFQNIYGNDPNNKIKEEKNNNIKAKVG